MKECASCLMAKHEAYIQAGATRGEEMLLMYGYHVIEFEYQMNALRKRIFESNIGIENEKRFLCKTGRMNGRFGLRITCCCCPFASLRKIIKRSVNGECIVNCGLLIGMKHVQTALCTAAKRSSSHQLQAIERSVVAAKDTAPSGSDIRFFALSIERHRGYISFRANVHVLQEMKAELAANTIGEAVERLLLAGGIV